MYSNKITIPNLVVFDFYLSLIFITVFTKTANDPHRDPDMSRPRLRHPIHYLSTICIIIIMYMSRSWNSSVSLVTKLLAR